MRPWAPAGPRDVPRKWPTCHLTLQDRGVATRLNSFNGTILLSQRPLHCPRGVLLWATASQEDPSLYPKSAGKALPREAGACVVCSSVL